MRTDDVQQSGGSGPDIEYPKFKSVNPNEKTDRYDGAIRKCRAVAFENKGSEAYPLEDKYKGLFQRIALLELTDGKEVNTYWKLVLNRFATSAEDEAVNASPRARQFSEACKLAGVQDWEEDLPGRTISIECFGKVKGGQNALDVRFVIGPPGSGDALLEAVNPLVEAQLKALNPGVDFDQLAKDKELEQAAKEVAAAPASAVKNSSDEPF